MTSSPLPTPLEVTLNRYQAVLDYLDAAKAMSLEKDIALEILAARDALQQQLEAEAEIPVVMWSKLIEQDTRLKQRTYKITEILDLAEYRETLTISDDAWWWNLESRESLHPCNHFDWLLRIIKLLLLGVNFALIGTLATKFLGGGTGLLEIGSIIFSTFISLLQTQEAVTKARQEGFVKLMKFFNIKEHWYAELQLLSTGIIFALLVTVFTHLPHFSRFYTECGKCLQAPPVTSQQNPDRREYLKWLKCLEFSPVASQRTPNLGLAEKKYLKAIELDPTNFDANYKLATLYEELQDLDNAKKQYLIAAKGGRLDAYNNLAYWYIRDNKDAEAVELLTKGQQILAEKDNKLDKFTEDEKRNLAVQKYSVHKNLGWARFKQNRNQDAIPNLSIAISIANNPAYQKYIRNPGAAYCIYAQVLQKQDKKSSSAKKYWQQCRKSIESRFAGGSTINAEEDKWLDEAKKQKSK